MPAPVFKVCLLGFEQTGKTALFNSISYQEFGETVPTIGAQFETLSTDGISFLLWDTAGGEKFSGLTHHYIQVSDIIILVVDPTNPNFAEQLDYFNGRLNSLEPTPKLLLVATKKDLVTPNNQATVDANIDAFHKKFANEADPKPLFVSAQHEITRDLLIEQIRSRLPVNDIVNDGAKERSIFGRLRAIERKLKKRYFKPDASRLMSIQRLTATLRNCASSDEIKNALIEEARFLRTPDENGKQRYGINLGSSRFKLFVHFRSYEHSELYQFLKSELRKINASIDLAKESDPKLAPVVAASHSI